ncbi:unnamed protein product [Ectocarpus sp. 12 AP-2014]
MKLSVFLVLLPSVSAFVSPKPVVLNNHLQRQQQQQQQRSSTPTAVGSWKQADGEPWSIATLWRDVVGSAMNKAKVESTAAEAYHELKKKVLVKKERQSLEGQLSSLICIEGNSMSCKKQDCVRRLSTELESLQDNAAEFGSQKSGLTGSWKLIYSSAACEGNGGGRGGDRLTTIENISYVSENYRLSHSGEQDDLRVYKRVSPPPARGDDTSAAMVGGAGGRKKAAGRAAAAAVGAGGRRGVAKPPLRRRTFFGFLRRQ